LPVRGNTRWTPQRLVWSAVLLSWSEQPQLVERFHGVRRFLKAACPHWRLGTSYDGWRTALQREQPSLLPLITARLRQAMCDLPAFQQRGRWQAFAADGSNVTCPRTLANQQALGDVGQVGGVPLLSLTSLVHLELNLPWAFRVGPGTDSERAHLRDMLDDLPAGSLLVADAGFIGYELCRDLLARGQHFLFRVGGNVHLLSELGYAADSGEQTVYLWPLDQQQQNQPPLHLRLIVVRDERKQPVYLVSSVLTADALTDQEAGEVYAKRWGIEVQFRTLKQTMRHHRLHSRTPANCYLEMTWAVLGMWLLQLMTIGKLHTAGHAPQEASTARAQLAVRRTLRNEPPCLQTRHSLARVLARCCNDHYVRLRPKSSRDYPRKKYTKPPSPPKIKPPSPQQLKQAKQLMPINLPT
jgi:hypothetical protein